MSLERCGLKRCGLKTAEYLVDQTEVSRSSALRWLGIAVLLYGLFIGISYALAPLVSPGHGNAMFSALGVVLIGLCGAGLLWLPRRRR
jgi:hypothetical protein